MHFAFSLDSQPGGTFPQVSDSTRVLADGSILGAPDAPICAVDSTASAAWKEVQTPIKSRYVSAIALRLPPGFSPAWFSHARDSGEEDPEDRGDSSNYRGHLLGSWDLFAGRGLESRSDFTVWIGPNQGYPSQGVGGAEVKQVSFRECRVQSELGLLPVVLYTLESPERRLGGYQIATYALLQPGVYLQAAGRGSDVATQRLLLQSIATMRVLR